MLIMTGVANKGTIIFQQLVNLFFSDYDSFYALSSYHYMIPSSIDYYDKQNFRYYWLDPTESFQLPFNLILSLLYGFNTGGQYMD